MKKIVSILLLLIMIVPASYAQAGKNKQAAVKSKVISLDIKGGKFTINKINLSDKWMMAPAVSVLGPAPRQKDGYNKTHSYDKLGIVLFESKSDATPSGKLSEFQVYFSPLEDTTNKIAPTGYFTGSFTIGSVKLTKDMTGDDLKAKMVANGFEATDSYMEHNFRFAKDGLYIYFLFDEIEQRLIKVSVGKDMRKAEKKEGGGE